jgi:serine/threonine-protein kinase HipA
MSKQHDAAPVPINVCPGTLAKGFNTYSPACLRNLFNNKKVSHILPYNTSTENDAVTEEFIENRKLLSISGVQEKLSLVLEKNVLRLTHDQEQGSYILKPIPRDVKKVDQVPANEHLTMQIAKQVYGMPVAENALIFFQDGSPAYITRRFDLSADGKKLGKEDFSTLAGKSKDNAGPNFKYEYSYEELGLLIHQYVPAWRIEIEKYFTLVVFNYAFSNGDAHLKNFSLLESRSGDYVLSPAYDLINTRIHVSDTDFALTKKLFADDFKSPLWKQQGHPSARDFRELAKRIGISDSKSATLLKPFLERKPLVEALIQRSFLNEASKTAYLLHYNTRRNLLIA